MILHVYSVHIYTLTIPFRPRTVALAEYFDVSACLFESRVGLLSFPNHETVLLDLLEDA